MHELLLGLFIVLVIILITFAPATPIEPCPSGNPRCVRREVVIDPRYSLWNTFHAPGCPHTHGDPNEPDRR
jgi:hypothetical protein